VKLFISYARVDKLTCENLVRRLSRVHDIWYDHRLHAGQAWWDKILEKLDWCEGLIYLMSPESLESEYCRKEVEIAQGQGKFIFPVTIRHPRGARLSIPDMLKNLHVEDLSESLDQVDLLKDALTAAAEALYERRLRQHTPQPPPKTVAPPGETTPTDAIKQAADAMQDGDYDKAVFILKAALEKCQPNSRELRIITANLREAEAELERQTYEREAEREYQPIRAAVLSRAKSTRQIGCEEFADFRKQFSNYDPDDLARLCEEFDTKPEPPPPPARTKPRVIDLFRDTPPFAWCDIPAGKVKLTNTWDDAETYVGKKGESKTFDVSAFAMAKYPVTNAQYAKFMETHGYSESQ
jgi:hypothetical protein